MKWRVWGGGVCMEGREYGRREGRRGVWVAREGE